VAERTVDVADAVPGAATAAVSTQERPSPTIVTTFTADPGTGGTTWTVASTALFPASGTFKLRAENEVVTASVASGTTFTVTRAQDGTAAATHAIGVVVAQVVALQRVVTVSERSISFVGALAANRIVGNAATPHNLLTIENGAGSNVLVGVNKLSIDTDCTAVLASVACQFRVHRTTALPSAGTVLTKQAIDTALTSSASVQIRGASDSASVATAITATAAAGSGLWCQSVSRLHSAAGQWLPLDNDLLPGNIAENDWIVLRASQALVVRVEGTAASNAATNHYMCKIAWFEFSVP